MTSHLVQDDSPSSMNSVPLSASSPRPGASSLEVLPLAALAPTLPALICGLDLPAAEAEWLRAIGLGEGQQITVLRRALFGGPLHVRTSAGAEFALDRDLARRVTVQAPRVAPVVQRLAVPRAEPVIGTALGAAALRSR